jgi:NADH-quinone oxidoreductase subunit M
MVTPLFVVPFTTLVFTASLSAGAYTGNQLQLARSPFSSYGLVSVVKLATLLSLNISLAYGAFLWNIYPLQVIEEPLEEWLDPTLHLFYPSSPWFELQHNLGLPFLLLSTFILLIAVLTAWYSITNPLLFTNLILVTELFLAAAFSCTNLFMFLLFFEAAALPVFILIVYCGSPRRERLKAAYYFLFFTLYGSISLLLLSLNLYSLNQLMFINNSFVDQLTTPTMWLLLFVAFAVKIPLFPFHIWLPYAHVEASTATSIVLAALMLKLGGYGVLKFMLPLFTMETHLFFRPAALLICVVGVIYGGLASLRQLDLKRQLAFSSISHMSFITAGIFTFTEAGAKGAVYLMLSHGLTSAALFYLVGVLSDRYHTRSVLIYSGLFGVMPLFAGFFILASLANVGFPGTSGFLPEFFMLTALVQAAPLTLLPMLLGMLLTTAGVLISLLRLLFGHPKVAPTGASWVDISKLEFFVLSALGFWILILGLYDILAF